MEAVSLRYYYIEKMGIVRPITYFASLYCVLGAKINNNFIEDPDQDDQFGLF
jgi:hypothetical protein